MTIRTLLITCALAALGAAGAWAAEPATSGATAAPASADPTAAPAAATAAPVAATASPSAEGSAIAATVKKVFLSWQAGKIDRSAYDAEMNKALTDATIAQVSTQLRAFGAPTKVTFLDWTVVNDNRAYTYGVETPKGNVRVLYVLDGAGKISGLYFRPAP